MAVLETGQEKIKGDNKMYLTVKVTTAANRSFQRKDDKDLKHLIKILKMEVKFVHNLRKMLKKETIKCT